MTRLMIVWDLFFSSYINYLNGVRTINSRSREKSSKIFIPFMMSDEVYMFMLVSLCNLSLTISSKQNVIKVDAYDGDLSHKQLS